MGDVFRGAGSFLEGQGIEKASKYNAEIDRLNARYAREQANQEARRIEEEGIDALGAMRANFAANGVTVDGSAFELIQQSSRRLRQDIANTQIAGVRQATGLEQSARLKIYEGKVARNAKRFEAAAYLASAGEKAASGGAGGGG